MYVIIAGDSGVFFGEVPGPEALGADGRVELGGTRHLRRYIVAGRKGDGGIADLARLGLDPASPSVTPPVPGVSVLLGVRRMFPVSPAVVQSFLC